MAPARELFSSFQEGFGGNRTPSFRLRAKRSKKETETEGTERREWIKREGEIHPLISFPFLDWVVSGDGIQETGPPGPTADVPQRWQVLRRLASSELGMHAQIGHNEPNQPTSVHTIDNKPYIFDSRSLRRRAKDGDDLYLRIAETWSKFVATAEEDGSCVSCRSVRAVIGTWRNAWRIAALHAILTIF